MGAVGAELANKMVEVNANLDEASLLKIYRNGERWEQYGSDVEN